MKRRDFVAAGATGAIGAGLSGCSGLGSRKFVISEKEPTAINLKKKVPAPVGTMPMGVLGETGIKVSKIAFGSHMLTELREYEKEREWMIREANDLGVNLFDVYDIEHKVYQYEPMGRYLQPIRKDVSISITLRPYDGRNFIQEFERDLKAFRTDYIDMVRIHATKKDIDAATPSNQRWEWWEQLFKLKEQGKIRAVGIPVHNHDELAMPLAEVPLDFVILPYNFYHNWYRLEPQDFDSLIKDLRKRGIGVITMKPRLGDRLSTPFQKIAQQIEETGSVNYSKACLRYIINAPVEVDSTLVGMNNPYHVHENIDAFFNPGMSDEERKLISKLRKVAKINNVTKNLLPEYYKFLDEYAPDSWDDSDLFGTA
jgi:predicted aldo/keto reductase-like oxidoreductase